ncbi:hypothetical protein BS78_03G100200 [Paspalum vaginatum]|nr:hypothetical protein BS78_03G100200 [Paspalum vaginatum]
MEENVEEILFRVPPDEPAHLIRAALVCKTWRRILSDGGFRRRYCRFHRAPPLLGYFHHLGTCADGPQLVAAASVAAAFTTAPASPGGGYALDCRHGRVLIYTFSSAAATTPGLIVWDPITGSQEPLSMPADYHQTNTVGSFTGAVLCALHGHGCDHLDCHGGPFLVVFVATHAAVHATATHTWATVYSSETGAWSAAQASSSTDNNGHLATVRRRPSLLIGDALYFTLVHHFVIRILKYDLVGGGGLSVINDTPQVSMFHDTAVAIEIDGQLGLVELSSRSFIYTWSQRQASAAANGGGVGGGGGGWVRNDDDAVELQALIPPRRHTRELYPRHPCDSIRFVEGTNTVLVSINNSIAVGVFAIDLKSRQVRKVAETWDAGIIPYMSFYTLAACHQDDS